MIKILIKLFALFPYERLVIAWTTESHKRSAVTGPGTTFYKGSKVMNLMLKKEKITIGANTHIRGELLLFAHGGKITIGNYCYIGESTRIWSAKEVSIGNHVLIAHNVNIHDNISHPTDLEERRKHAEQIFHKGHPKEGVFLKEEPITINDDAWIGFNATILRGVTIGRGAIVGACSVVTADVPDFGIVIGNPARIIGYANENK